MHMVSIPYSNTLSKKKSFLKAKERLICCYLRSLILAILVHSHYIFHSNVDVDTSLRGQYDILLLSSSVFLPLVHELKMFLELVN